MTTREMLDQSGGLINTTGLAERYGVTRRQVNNRIKSPDFPKPYDVIGEGKERVWLVEEVDAYDAEQEALHAKILESLGLD